MSVQIVYTKLWSNQGGGINHKFLDQPYTVLMDDREYVVTTKNAVNSAGVPYTYLGSFCDAGKWYGNMPFCLCWVSSGSAVRSIEAWFRDDNAHVIELYKKNGSQNTMSVAENVAKAADEAPTKEEFDALIDSLIAAGIMAAPTT